MTTTETSGCPVTIIWPTAGGDRSGTGEADDIIDLRATGRGGVAEACEQAGYAVGIGTGLDDVPPSQTDRRQMVVLSGARVGWLRMASSLCDARGDVDPIVVGGIGDGSLLVTALRLGVAGYCDEWHGPSVAATVSGVCADGVSVPRRFVPILVESLREGSTYVIEGRRGEIRLTDREWEVLLRVWQRRSTAEMARNLFVSKGTVRSHVSTILHKLGADDRDEAVAIFDRFVEGNSAVAGQMLSPPVDR